MRKTLGVFLSLLIVIFSTTIAFSGDEQTIITEPIQAEYENELNKLHFYFDMYDNIIPVKKASNLSLATDNNHDTYLYIDSEDELSAAVENMNKVCSETTGDEQIKITVEFNSEYENTDEFLNFRKKREKIKTVEELDRFRQELNAYSKEFHRKENLNNIHLLNDIDYKSIEITNYAPFVILDVNRDDIQSEALLNLAQSDKITNVSLHLEEEFSSQASWDRTLKEIDAYDIVNDSTYTGNRIKIGVIEPGICDTSHINFSSFVNENEALNRLFVDPYTDISDIESDYINHATGVTSIIATMAPHSTLYVSNSVYRGLDWCISQGCSVINCSFGGYTAEENSDTGLFEFSLDLVKYRYYYDGLFDYKIKANMINVVVSAGNVDTNNKKQFYNPDGYVTTPGLAYNAITVGALDCEQVLFSYDLEHRSSSCYRTPTNRVKPEISAIGEVDIPNIEGTKTGTSFAAPQVTAALALLFEKEPALSTSVSAVKAAVIASATKTENYTNIANSYFDEKVGAGCINLEELLDFDSINFVRNRNSTSVPNSYIISKTISLGWRDDLQVAAVWIAENNDTNTEQYNVTNYDIEVYNSSGTLVCSSTLDYCSSEFLRYTAPRSGDYTVKVYQNGPMPDNVTDDYISLLCNIIS